MLFSYYLAGRGHNELAISVMQWLGSAWTMTVGAFIAKETVDKSKSLIDKWKGKK
jgi:hypothetical protein